MASLFRNSRSIITRFSYIRRNAATVVAASTGTQVKTSGATTNVSQVSNPPGVGNLAVRDARRRLTPADPIKPRPAGEPPLVPLVGKSLTTSGWIGFGIIFAISAYFIYINYIINPEFYKSLKTSREASKRDKEAAHHEGAADHKH